MSNLKYLNICAGSLGIAAAVIGGTILFKQTSAKAVIAGSTLFCGGSLLTISCLCQFQIDKEIESGIDNVLEERRKAIPKTCRGCSNFHGIKHGGVMLICAIHPSGVEGNTCPDFESFG
ncbi:hypothetical protein [Nostoc sp. UHCC 0252]|uniref:hypothetical protein n=1 Tax=Nostoc sp. UHCC 0252 TaxID=3110241 RepID=UPI002B21270D|nr:hypothetical protein [Nostoc sp. UHCC 0252]MEA5603210.1 hypothetical protein [Nostoc sp. UHCC 0252]